MNPGYGRVDREYARALATTAADVPAWSEFPSQAAFMAVVTDPDRLAAQRRHREPAMTDTCTLVLRPTLDRLGAAPS